MLLKNLIDAGLETVSALYPEKEAREMVFILLERLLGTRRYTHITDPAFEVSDADSVQVLSSFRRLAAGEPIQYVTGIADFYGREFHVGPSVLIPRPETELLCRTALEHLPAGRNPRILDLCTGSGCIAWTLALESPGSEVYAVDISDSALEMAVNQDFSDEIRATGARPPSFMKADVLAGPEALIGLCGGGTYDLILSNPPYVMHKEKSLMRRNVLEHEPHLALFVPDEDPLLFYRAVAGWSAVLLSADGFGIVEINEALGSQTAEVFVDAGFSAEEVARDLNDRDRFVIFHR